MRSSTPRRRSAQNVVIASPSTYSIAKYGRPSAVMPPSKTRATDGWSSCARIAEHAKGAERDYLNFLNNAEHEEYQELSASQNVEMEKANVRIETARVDQASAEVTAAT